VKYSVSQLADLESSREAMERDGGLAPRLKARLEILCENFDSRAHDLFDRLPGMVSDKRTPEEDE
jgi:hypothetical protein